MPSALIPALGLQFIDDREPIDYFLLESGGSFTDPAKHRILQLIPSAARERFPLNRLVGPLQLFCFAELQRKNVCDAHVFKKKVNAAKETATKAIRAGIQDFRDLKPHFN